MNMKRYIRMEGEKVYFKMCYFFLSIYLLVKFIFRVYLFLVFLFFWLFLVYVFVMGWGKECSKVLNIIYIF